MAGVSCAVSAAVEGFRGLDAVADDAASAVIADGCKTMNGALKAVEGVALTGNDDDHGFVVLVAAGFALHERKLPESRGGGVLTEKPEPVFRRHTRRTARV